jgi:hypothetical protein
MFCRNRFVVSANCVNPLYIIQSDQILRHDGSLVAIASEPDLIWAKSTCIPPDAGLARRAAFSPAENNG